MLNLLNTDQHYMNYTPYCGKQHRSCCKVASIAGKELIELVSQRSDVPATSSQAQDVVSKRNLWESSKEIHESLEKGIYKGSMSVLMTNLQRSLQHIVSVIQLCYMGFGDITGSL